MGFENPQAVYKWLRGESLPSIDNLLILGKILNTKLENILAINGGDVVFLRQIILNRRFNDKSPLLSYTLSQKRERKKEVRK